MLCRGMWPGGLSGGCGKFAQVPLLGDKLGIWPGQPSQFISTAQSARSDI
jgi:hypothetical protein